MSTMTERIAISKVHPSFLKSNATSHPWPFSAIAEIIDNSYDAKAREVQIDFELVENEQCLSFIDDGRGMAKDELYGMLSFGYCDHILSTAIGRYGNGFKSSSMRLGKDAMVFTKTAESAAIGFLSQTFNQAINADSVRVPMIHFSLPGLMSVEDDGREDNLNAILTYSPFEDENQLRKQLRLLPKTGTRILIFNLEKSSDGCVLELDFDAAPDDIRCRKICDAGSQGNNRLRLKNSLLEYCRILYLHPRMKIKLRGKYVKIKLVAKSLCYCMVDEYTPKGHNSAEITFGCVPDSEEQDDCGMMLYTDNRLIKPYELVSCQKQGLGAGVVGVTQVKFLTPTHDKQDFLRDSKYMAAMAAYNMKLKNYWSSTQGLLERYRKCRPDTDWVQCDYKNCLKWRRLPPETDISSLPNKWYCYMHPKNIDCLVPADMHEKDEEIVRAPPRRRSGSKRQSEVSLSEQTRGRHGKQKGTTRPSRGSMANQSVDVDDDDDDDNDEIPSTSPGPKKLHLTTNIFSRSSAKINKRGKTSAGSRSPVSKGAARSIEKKVLARNHKSAVMNAATTTANNGASTEITEVATNGASTEVTEVATNGASTENARASSGDTTAATSSLDTSHDNSDTSNDINHSTNHSDTVPGSDNCDNCERKNQKISVLQHRLLEQENRINHLLSNSRQLLAMLAPEVPVGEDVDIEQLITVMVQSEQLITDTVQSGL